MGLAHIFTSGPYPKLRHGQSLSVSVVSNKSGQQAKKTNDSSTEEPSAAEPQPLCRFAKWRRTNAKAQGRQGAMLLARAKVPERPGVNARQGAMLLGLIASWRLCVNSFDRIIWSASEENER